MKTAYQSSEYVPAGGNSGKVPPCEGAESLGEGLRQSAKASRGFLEKIRREMPELVIENCSSGGHRLEPSMQAVIREGTEDAAGQMLIVIHRFYQGNDKREEQCEEGGKRRDVIGIPIKTGCWEIADRYSRSGIVLEMVRGEKENMLYVSGIEELDAVAVRLEKRDM